MRHINRLYPRVSHSLRAPGRDVGPAPFAAARSSSGARCCPQRLLLPLLSPYTLAAPRSALCRAHKMLEKPPTAVDIEFGLPDAASDPLTGGAASDPDLDDMDMGAGSASAALAYARSLDLQPALIGISALGALLLLFGGSFRPIFLYSAIARIAVAIAGLIFFSYALRPSSTLGSGVEKLGNFTLGLVASAAFLVGAVCSAAAGYVSMWVSARSNIRLGGGIYTKAADVGADLVGKVEVGIPEDDPRNPAVIADLVGDMVGDCVGSSADVFESVAAEIIGAMILGGTLAREAQLPYPIAFVFFPVVVHAFDIAVSSAGILMVRAPSDVEASRPDHNPMATLQTGYNVSLALALVGFAFTTRWLLYTPEYPTAWMNFFLCGVVGMLTAYVFVKSTQYYTDYAHPPVRSIAKASTTGHGTNIITGVAVGMKSTVVPTLMVSFAVISAYHLGAGSGIGGQGNRHAGLFGTAVATMGMLSSAVFVLAMNNYGPIADNAGGIAEMSRQPDYVRDATDKLDAAGNVTKAITKGYSIGSAALACFVLFGAFMDEFSEFAGREFKTVDIATVEVLVGGLLGTMMVFFFTGLAVAAVGETAGEVVNEVRHQFEIYPGIMEYKAKPDYRTCVALVTKAALKQMRFPGLLAVLMPVSVGIVFRVIGEYQGKPLLGAEALAGYLMFGTVTGIMMALFLDNVGGAWDNAKKYVELGNFGGKGSEAHKAAVTGDTVGDPFKDTAGPALHVVIKLLSTTVLVFGPLFVSRE
ncbi:hypothetical protein PHYSODRAFT_297061 [Phytophthora sojae]|uniref:H(+)-exporting diphosphatase n=1 Tax=Phytophthora sojae (strain P6497) TaxID=1094619 RepID=G4YSW0_PHYSP|nr:hypothetical protein PHYSODRAFT_297061 [Phytophthora sojae]EGZ25379.1 hypothetical protein PHYSODRAFT_297061 [Phytophthora sojae]|eukprot:XP_009520667.1 hypothetical protein PHYSODRAFT_297061 [Phytophthora sojae]